jgi:hypothetical protein
MLPEIGEFIKGKIIESIEIDYDHNHKINIMFKDEDEKCLRIRVDGDCCNITWFEELDDLKKGINKEIKDIKDTKEEIELPLSGISDYDDNHVWVIEFTDDFKLKFVMRNASNGYYSGVVSFAIKNKYEYEPY